MFGKPFGGKERKEECYGEGAAKSLIKKTRVLKYTATNETEFTAVQSFGMRVA